MKLTPPGIRGVTFVGGVQEFNQYYTPHKTKRSFALTGDQHRFSHAGGLQPCILERLQSPSENNQLLSKSTERALLKTICQWLATLLLHDIQFVYTLAFSW